MWFHFKIGPLINSFGPFNWIKCFDGDLHARPKNRAQWSMVDDPEPISSKRTIFVALFNFHDFLISLQDQTCHIYAYADLTTGHTYTAKRKPSKSFCLRSWRFFRLCLHVHITFLTSPSWSSCVINGFREFIIPRGSRISKRILSKFTTGIPR